MTTTTDLPELIAAIYREALCDDSLDTASDFFNRADEDLYRAKAASKRAGRAS